MASPLKLHELRKEEIKCNISKEDIKVASFKFEKVMKKFLKKIKDQGTIEEIEDIKRGLDDLVAREAQMQDEFVNDTGENIKI